MAARLGIANIYSYLKSMTNKTIDNYIKKNLEDSKNLLEIMVKDEELIYNLRKIALLCCSTIKNKGKIIFAGNGGSAADAQHFSTELMIRFEKKKKSYSFYCS